MKRWLFFDVGYTLMDESAVWRARCREQADMPEAREKGLTPETIYRAVENASRNYQPQFRGALNALGLLQTAPYRSELETLYPDAEPVLKQLSRKYSLGVIANQTAGLEKRLTEQGLSTYLSLTVSSYEADVCKPDPAIFILALKKAACAPESAVMIGDRLDNDVFPAKALGMKTVWVRQGFGALQAPRDFRYEPDWTVDSLPELLGIDFFPE